MCFWELTRPSWFGDLLSFTVLAVSSLKGIVQHTYQDALVDDMVSSRTENDLFFPPLQLRKADAVLELRVSTRASVEKGFRTW